MSEKRFTWEYSNYDLTGEIYDWIRQECLMTDYLQKYEIKEWCEELNKIVDENKRLKKCYNNVLDDMDALVEAYDKIYKENNKLKEKLRLKQKRIDSYEDYIKTLKEDGVLE